MPVVNTIEKRTAGRQRHRPCDQGVEIVSHHAFGNATTFSVLGAAGEVLDFSGREFAFSQFLGDRNQFVGFFDKLWTASSRFIRVLNRAGKFFLVKNLVGPFEVLFPQAHQAFSGNDGSGDDAADSSGDCKIPLSIAYQAATQPDHAASRSEKDSASSRRVFGETSTLDDLMWRVAEHLFEKRQPQSAVGAYATHQGHPEDTGDGVIHGEPAK